MDLNEDTSNPATDAASVDAMLNEGGRLQTGNLRHSALARSALADLPPEDRDADISGRGFTGLLKALLSGRISRRLANRRRTHMNSGLQRLWWHWPITTTVTALGIGVVIFLISISAFGAEVSLMLRKLI